MVKSVWEQIHSKRAWGKYPNEEVVKFIGRNFFRYDKEQRKNISVLEVGCGQGANLWFLAKEGFDVYGMDFSPSATKKAEKYLKEEYNVKADLRIADCRSLPYDNNMFDIAIDCATIESISFTDHEKAYREIHRVLKPESHFWGFHVAKGSWGYGTGKSVDHETFDNLAEGPLSNLGTICMPTDKDLRRSLAEQGFVINSIEKHVRTYENQQKEVIHWIIEARKSKS